MDLKKFIQNVPDFPKAGVNFLDISPLISDQEAFQASLESLAQILPIDEVDIIAGIEMRGVIFGAALASKFKKGFLPIRKAGKLPPPVLKESYKLEYGSAEIEMKAGHGNILIVDDVLATGGTLEAAVKLVTKAGFTLKGLGVVINIQKLNNVSWNNRPVPSLLKY